ncbi:MAG: hypothetical protein JJ957_16145 [Pseudomonadales bacterium]|nr:hypothetical protein [Pseudomonadales bacterium]
MVFWSFKDVLASIDKLEERGEVDDFMAFHKQGYGRALNIQKFRVQLLELYELEKSQKNFNSDHASRNLQHAIHRNWAVRAIVRYTAIGLATGFYPEFSYYRIMTANNLDNLHISLPVVLNFFPANRKSLLHMWLSGNMSLDILAHPPDMANIAGTVFRARNWTSLSIPTDPIQVSGDEELKSTIDHELGHYFGLRHVFAKQGKKGTAERIFYDLANDPKSTCGKGQWLVAENNRIRDWDGVKGVYDTLPSANSLLKKGDQEGYLKTPCFTEYKSVYDSSSAPASQKLAMRADMNLMSYSSAKKRGFTADQLEQMASSIKSVLATNSTAGVCKND